MQMDQIGQGIMSRRKQLMLSQEDLASKIGVTRQAVSRWESGTALPSVDNMVELSRALEISVDELLQLAPQKKESTLTPQSLGLLLDEHTSRQERRIRWLTIALVAAAIVLVAGIAVSTAVNMVRSSHMETQLNEQIRSMNRTVSASISSMDARIGQTVQQALNEGNSRLADSSTRTAYDHGSRSFVVTLNAQVQELGEYANAEFYILSGNGQRFSTPAEWSDSGFTGDVHIPDAGQEFVSGRAYLSWQENGETITERIPFYDTGTYHFRPEFIWVSLNHSMRQGHDIKVNPYTQISFSYEDTNTYPVSICYELYHNGRLLQTITEPITIRHNEINRNILPTTIAHTLPDFISLEGISSTDGLLLRVTMTDALGREYTREHTPK